MPASPIQNELSQRARGLAALIDGDLHRTINDPNQEDGDDYQRCIAPLRRVLASSNGLRFVYTAVLKDGRVHLVLDATPRGDADHDGVEDHSNIMEKYDSPDAEMLIALREGRATANAAPHRDKRGALLSGYAPFYDSAGRQVDITAGNVAGATRGAHSLKGSAAYVGAERFRTLAATLESVCREGHLDQAGEHLEALKAEAARCLQAAPNTPATTRAT
jgi:hypothetical protein